MIYYPCLLLGCFNEIGYSRPIAASEISAMRCLDHKGLTVRISTKRLAAKPRTMPCVDMCCRCGRILCGGYSWVNHNIDVHGYSWVGEV